MRVVLLCATRRGLLFLEKLVELLPKCNLTVLSFREEEIEPPFMDSIRELSLASNGKFFECKRVESKSMANLWESKDIDLMFVVSWRYIIPASIFDRPRLGTYVFHDSLLPRYRGFSPTVWSMINGENHTGVTLFQMAEDVDSGDIIDQQPIWISPDNTISEVMESVTQVYLDLLEENLPALLNGTAPSYPQDDGCATYTSRRFLKDNLIDWAGSSKSIYNLIRAVSEPFTGAFTHLSGKKMQIWSGKIWENKTNRTGAAPGRVLEIRNGKGVVVQAGTGSILIVKVQMEGGVVVDATDVIRNTSLIFGKQQ